MPAYRQVCGTAWGAASRKHETKGLGFKVLVFAFCSIERTSFSAAQTQTLSLNPIPLYSPEVPIARFKGTCSPKPKVLPLAKSFASRFALCLPHGHILPNQAGVRFRMEPVNDLLSRLSS